MLAGRTRLTSSSESSPLPRILATVVSEIPCPNLLHEHLAASLAGDPFVVGRKADPNGFHAAQSPLS